MSNNIITEIQELIQQIKKEYREGVDYEFVTKKEWEKRGMGWMNILSSRLKKYCREKFNFPLSFNDYLDYQKNDKGGSWFTYRTRKNTSKYDNYDCILSLKIFSPWYPDYPPIIPFRNRSAYPVFCTITWV